MTLDVSFDKKVFSKSTIYFLTPPALKYNIASELAAKICTLWLPDKKSSSGVAIQIYNENKSYFNLSVTGNKFAILEMKAMISAILRRCHLGSVEGKTEVQPKFRVTVRASGGLWVKITQRVDSRWYNWRNFEIRHVTIRWMEGGSKKSRSTYKRSLAIPWMWFLQRVRMHECFSFFFF